MKFTQVKHSCTVLLVTSLLFFLGCKKEVEIKQPEIYSWNILTDHTPTAFFTLEATTNYDVNQIQLSGEICKELRDVKHQWNRNIVNNLTERAHEIGIPEVLVWDKALYPLKYYPDRFKINGKINLDDNDFWKWLYNDYKKMLDKIPEVNGIVLSLNETETKVEEQHSEILNTAGEKLATFVDSLSCLIVKQREMELYLRYKAYSRKDIKKLVSFLKMIKTPGIRFMENALPGKYLTAQKYSEWVGKIPVPVVIDFDCAHVNEGQANVAAIFPELHLNQWKYYQRIPNVKGFSLRTDRLGKTSIIGRPSEINLFAVYEAARDPGIEPDSAILNYLYLNYDTMAVPCFFDAFKLATEIIMASFYTLGVNTTDHSQTNFSYKPSFVHKTTIDEPEDSEIEIGHGVNKTFLYWSEIINHLAPSDIKTTENGDMDLLPRGAYNNWLHPGELMDSTWLDYIITEKEYAVNLASEAISKINMAKPYCNDHNSFNCIYHTFNRTLLTAKLRKAYAQVYYANRVWNRGEEFQNDKLLSMIKEGISEIQYTSEDIKRYRRKGPAGQYSWEEDADIALKLIQEIDY